MTAPTPRSGGATYPWGINNAGQITGLFAGDGGIHRFLATPVSAVPEPTAFPLFATGLGFAPGNALFTSQHDRTTIPARPLRLHTAGNPDSVPLPTNMGQRGQTL